MAQFDLHFLFEVMSRLLSVLATLDEIVLTNEDLKTDYNKYFKEVRQDLSDFEGQDRLERKELESKLLPIVRKVFQNGLLTVIGKNNYDIQFY